MKNIYIYLVLAGMFSCADDSNQELADAPESQINIYLVKDTGQEFYDGNVNLNTLETEEEPWINNSEILFYDWSAHMFYLNTGKERGKYSGRNFVVKADDEPLFAGVFFPPYLSSIPQLPSIIATDGLFEPEDVVGFGQLGHIYTGGLDSLLNFKKALLESGKLKNGIDVELLNIEKSGNSEIHYTFKVTNKDLENIYVPDPAKMGAGRFHYYTNGVTFFDENTYYFSDFESTPSTTISEGWYMKLHPGESMTRTVSLNGFPELPTGNVKCSFSFPGGKVKKGEWLKSDGRIWLGDFFIQREVTLD